MSISVGDKIPDVKLVKATAEGPQPVQSAEYFAGRRIALFSVPGAFTPTCSARHLPGFVEKSAELAAKGIDEIARRFDIDMLHDAIVDDERETLSALAHAKCAAVHFET